MVSLENSVIRLGDKSYNIKHFSVWFRTPKGLCSTLNLAIEVCNGLNIEPDLNIQAVCVAIADENIYEEM